MNTKKPKDNKKRVKGTSAYDEALYFLTPKARTVRETENHLDECNFSEVEIMQSVERLTGNGLLNDEKYAADFIESRLAAKPVSRQKLREQLEGHFIDGETIDSALAAVTDEIELGNARTVAAKFFRQFSGLELSERLRRVGLRLASRGFSFDDIKTVLSEITEDLDGEEE